MDSVKYVEQLLAERYSSLDESINQVMAAYGRADFDQIKVRTQKMLSDTDAYLHVIPSAQHPGWLTYIRNAADRFQNMPDREKSLELHRAIASQMHKKRPIELGRDAAISFDELYSQIRADGKLPQLFDQMVNAIEEMLANKAIDSVAIRDALARLLSVLNANRRGSFTAQRGAVFFARFIWNSIKENVKAYAPVVGPTIQAWEKTIEEAEAESQHLEEEMRRQAFEMLMPTASVAFLQSVRTLSIAEAPADEAMEVETLEFSSQKNGNIEHNPKAEGN